MTMMTMTMTKMMMMLLLLLLSVHFQLLLLLCPSFFLMSFMEWVSLLSSVFDRVCGLYNWTYFVRREGRGEN